MWGFPCILVSGSRPSGTKLPRDLMVEWIEPVTHAQSCNTALLPLSPIALSYLPYRTQRVQEQRYTERS
jgi:hypothetical protein